VVNTLELHVARGPQRLLATVLFTDIVGSTERAPGGRPAGRAARREADQEHRRWHPGGLRRPRSGHPLRSGAPSGAARQRDRDPGRAPTPARSTSTGDDVGGIAVHTAARTMAAAGPGEILVSRTVRNSHPQGPGGRREKTTIAGRFSPDQRYWRLCASRSLTRSSSGRSTTRTSMPASRRAAAGHERGERKGAAAAHR
jgi:hypothetical protein